MQETRDAERRRGNAPLVLLGLGVLAAVSCCVLPVLLGSLGLALLGGFFGWVIGHGSPIALLLGMLVALALLRSRGVRQAVLRRKGGGQG